MSTPKKPKLYKTATVLKRRLRVDYPSGNGRLVLRTEDEWDKDAIKTTAAVQ